MHLLIRLKRFENILRKNDYFLTPIIDYNIFGSIANLLLPSRAAPGSQAIFLHFLPAIPKGDKINEGMDLLRMFLLYTMNNYHTVYI